MSKDRSRSLWRARAEKVITEVLASLPDGASLREKRRALSSHYPFGPRQYHPYNVWCKAVRAALGLTAESRDGGPDLPPHAPRLVLDPLGVLSVACGWCGGRIKGGCLCCLPHHQEVRALLAWGQWPAWKAALVAGDALAGPVLADRLDDQGHTLLPPFFRGVDLARAPDEEESCPDLP